MAHVTLNVAFRSLHGRVGGAVFYERYGKQFMRPYVIPSNPNTAAQRVRRCAFREAVRAWQALPVPEKGEWNDRGIRKRKSGYNLFISCYLTETTTQPAMTISTDRKEVTQGRADLLRVQHNSGSLLLPAVTAPYHAGSRVYPPCRPRISRCNRE